MREGRAARGERCAANSARVVAALHESPTAVGRCGCEGALRAAPMAGARSLPRTVRHFSAARGKCDAMTPLFKDESTKNAERRCSRRPNDGRLSCGEASRASGTGGAPLAATNDSVGGLHLQAA
jgi:hypothetical protein